MFDFEDHLVNEKIAESEIPSSKAAVTRKFQAVYTSIDFERIQRQLSYEH